MSGRKRRAARLALHRLAVHLAFVVAAAAAVIWLEERSRIDSESHPSVWGHRLGDWVGRLASPASARRDSATAAVGTLLGERAAAGLSFGPAEMHALEALADRLGDDDEVVRDGAVWAMLQVAWQTRGASAPPPWSAVLVRDVTSSVLGRATRTRGPSATRIAALRVLLSVGLPEFIGTRAHELAASDADSDVRALAVALVLRDDKVRDPSTWRTVVRHALTDESAEVKLAALEALSTMADAGDSVIMHTVRRLTIDSDSLVRTDAWRVLAARR